MTQLWFCRKWKVPWAPLLVLSLSLLTHVLVCTCRRPRAKVSVPKPWSPLQICLPDSILNVALCPDISCSPPSPRLLVSSERASQLPPQPCLWMLPVAGFLTLDAPCPKHLLSTGGSPSWRPAPWNQNLYVLRPKFTACWEDSVTALESIKHCCHQTVISHCHDPASQPGTSGFNL